MLLLDRLSAFLLSLNSDNLVSGSTNNKALNIQRLIK